MFVNFSDIPGHQNLFLDYLYEFENVSKFFPTNFRSKEEFLKIFRGVSESNKTDREKLVGILERQYSGFDLSEKTRGNLELLKSRKTLAVVTGQQLGIFGGPLYTFYKIITAIKLSNYLSERYDEYKFVPVFWLEGDDHDFNEIRYINLVNNDNEFQKFAYGEEVEEDTDKGSVGYLKLDDSINNFFDEVNGNIRNTEFTGELLDKLKSFYSPGRSLKDSFREMVFWLFDKYGLLIFDPQDKEIKDLLRPVFRKEIKDFRKHTEKLVSVSAELEDVYHAQVKVRPVNLFYSTDGGRFLIDPVENEFRLRKKRKKFTFEEINNLIDTDSDKFSANVLLRPICQDYILPTAFYVGGPSEIAYFAQVMPLYEFYNIQAPLIYPRCSATIVEKNIASVIDKYNIEVRQIFWETEALIENVISKMSNVTIDDIFSDATEKINMSLDNLKEKLFEFDKTISDASTKYRQKILNYMEELKGKAIESQKRKHETTTRQVEKLSTTLFPNASLQERELNFVYFANKYGTDFLQKIFDELEINKFEHQLIDL